MIHTLIYTSIHDVILTRPKSLNPARRLTPLYASIMMYFTPFIALRYTYVPKGSPLQNTTFPRVTQTHRMILTTSCYCTNKLVVLTEPERVKGDTGAQSFRVNTH